jgi:hypothetical protein
MVCINVHVEKDIILLFLTAKVVTLQYVKQVGHFLILNFSKFFAFSRKWQRLFRFDLFQRWNEANQENVLYVLPVA